ncbi:RDD family protein [Arthrobacter gandavensis]|uniref:RDD family protein n=1 Tax=Arthrobacter gandavensis TaxID=169960 RepID=UPI00188E238F|nr:RDD family protein [Arthrobacter gandavensis]MBF4992948.1 RDD family protein [Arthrobacter gandavensis]
MVTNPNLVNATAGQRLAARAVDSVPLVVLVLVAALVPGQPALFLSAAAAAGYLAWTWLWEARSGQTPGNRVLGLRTVNEDGLAPGFTAVLVRNLLLTVSAVTVAGPWIMTVSNLWDHPTRRQGWHDKAARTLVVDIRAGRDPLLTGGRWAGAAAPGPVPAAAPATGWVPEPSTTPGPSAPPPAAPAGPAEPISSVPGARGTTEAAAAATQTAVGIPAVELEEEEDVELTRIVSRGQGAGCRLVFDDGAAVRVTGTALLGRNPAAAIGETVNQLIDFADMGRSVSKTHLHLQSDGSTGLWITDRGSTNGSSIVAPDGRHEALAPHSPVLAPSGSTVYFGDRHFTVG